MRDRALSEECRTAPDAARAKELSALLDRAVAAVPSALVHGTSTEYLPSILANGLGGVVPKGASSGGRTYVCPAADPSGMLGSYAFALRSGAMGLPFRSPLSFRAPRSVVDRYVETLHLTKPETTRARRMLTAAGLAYALKRGRMKGEPMLLVIDGTGVPLAKTRNGTAVDYSTDRPVPASAIRLVLVPARSCETVANLLAGYSCTVLPIELMEAQEIARTVPLRGVTSRPAREPLS